MAGEPQPAPEAAAPARDEPDLGVAEVCDRTGLSPRTLRYYEELGLLPGVRRRAGGRRAYGRDELERLRFVQRLKTLGLSLAEIKELNQVHALSRSTRAMLEHLDGVLGRRLAELDDRIAELTSLRDQMRRYRGRVERRIADAPGGAQGGPGRTGPQGGPGRTGRATRRPAGEPA